VTAGKEDVMRKVVALVAAAVLATGCAADRPQRSGGGGEAPAFPVTIRAANGRVDIPARPERIVSLSPTSTEMLFAIEAGDQVEAVDDASTYPPKAPRTDLSGYEPNVEAIAGYEPDLVVMAEDPGGLVASLGRLGFPVISQPAAQTLEDTYEQIEELGVATGHQEDAAALTEDMQSRIEDLVTEAPSFDRTPTYYHELDQTFFTVTSETFIGQVYSLVGLRNIADQAKGAGTGYPQLSAEYILQADPDFIFLADTRCCGQSAKTVGRRPGWGDLQAVREGSVVELDDDIVSRWGPRVVDFLRSVVDALRAQAPGTG
jgi:iron complex transport system substrate-binding protein